MNLSNYTTARARFFSAIESNGTFNLTGPDINENVTLKIKDLKGLLSYGSAVLTREPIVNDTVDLMTATIKVADEDLSYEAFLNTTKLNDNISFYFQATTFVNKVPLMFNDIGLKGDENEYKPFDSSSNKAVDSMLTATLDEVRLFSEKYFKFRNYRGTAAFERATTHIKGHTIYLTDKGLYMTIIAAKYDMKTGRNSYIAVMYIGD